ncbi:DUF802 domain-containing protein [Marinobacter salinexigens]|uniref:DUF802 domain-containing protein n=1 Tax=Marinobacter salinexigens TaxID=2919747 RepID=A0A5B0VQB6_9GAMM|nr:DUF802 domain-containing protein [Marinobacter salinexigens]KAA1176019.1 DUF802 domain-containing protein [Marinobacter salinexigens]
MSKLFFTLAFAIGLAVVCWIGAGFIGSDQLALAFTGIIGAVFCLGIGELVGFRSTTLKLSDRLDQAPTSEDQLNNWLDGLPEPIQFAVQRRLEGHGAALPGPQLTPYLTGLLVMLGLLGTFAGMIVTLSGAASALDGSTELSVIRSSLAAPIAGLSLAFGTSIAGVAASAMLGLASTLSRRDRSQVSRKLDRSLRQKLHHLSADYQRHQAFSALESQARALPEMSSAMETMTARMEQLGKQLEQSLTRNQQEFHSTVGTHYQTLADSVAQSLKEALDSSSQQAAERIEPIVGSAMDKLTRDAESLHSRWSATTETRLGQIIEAFQTTTAEAGNRWQQNLDAQQKASTELHQAEREHSQRSQKAMLEQLQQWLSAMEHSIQSHQEQFREQLSTAGKQLLETSGILMTRQSAGLEALTSTVSEQLSVLRDQEAARGEAAAERLASLEATVTRHLSELGTALEEPMTRLIETASETPKAAAEVIKQLQTEITRNGERENELLEERKRLVEELDGLLESQRTSADDQRQAVDSLISGASETLAGISERFSTLVNEQSQQLGRLGEDISGSSLEVGALSESFEVAVEQFIRSNAQLQESLAEIQKALDSATTRHDEQLAYYVAQAREVIDLSVSSQKDVIDAVVALHSSGPASSEAN